ncbi:MAG: FAD-dependent oxidoreductase [Nitrospinota bacterium]
MDKKVGVYICTGCDIGESLDIDKLSTVATKKYKVPICKTHSFLCGEEGVDLIKKDIEGEGVNTVIIAACSPRVNYDVFYFDPLSIISERVNLREQVVWCQKPKNGKGSEEGETAQVDEDIQMMGEDYLRMGIVKAQKSELPEPFKEEMAKSVLVVGGGITGMTSALESAKAGYQVVLVEKTPKLGGFMAKLYKQFPKRPPYHDLEETGIESKIEEVEEDQNIKVFTSAEIEKIAGAPGMFDVTIRQNGNSETMRMGSVILATGWRPYDATKVDHLGFGKYPNVVTSVMIEEMALKGRIVRPSDGKEAKKIAFIQCAGSRDENHLPYCSAVCCLTSLKQAKYLREQDPDTEVYILYKDVRSPGQHENFYKKVQEDEGIFFTKGEITGVEEEAGNNLIIEADDTLLGEKIKLKADMVVLAVGLEPNTKISEEKFEAFKKEMAEKDAADQAAPDKTEEEEEIIEPHKVPNILHLQYRQGPEIPELQYGFPDSHFLCFPYETRRTGIYTAGCAKHPMDGGASADDATGAALKAIQCMELTAQGKAVHPRAGDQTYPEFFLQRCTQCKRCTIECPFGVLDEDEKGTPKANPTRCRRCGVCMGACPERIVSFKNYSVDIISSMLKAIDVPEEDEEKPRIVALVCENDAYPAIDMVGIKRLTYNPNIRVIPLRCLGSTNLVWIADAMSKGIDGLIMMGCKHGDDYQCHFIKGSELAEVRLGKVQDTLNKLQLEAERIEIHQFSIDEYKKIPAIFDKFLEKIDEIGPNPFKDF